MRSELDIEVELEERATQRHVASLSPFDRAVWELPAEAGLNVWCPTCGAEPGTHCRLQGVAEVQTIHAERRAKEVCRDNPSLEGEESSWWTRWLRK